jgi:hypothetical protein
MQEDKILKICGTKKDIDAILKRLISKYGKKAKLIDVLNKEYDCKEVILK